MQSSRTARNAGFTLVEVVITIVIVGIIGGIATMIILQGVRAYSDEQSRSDVHYQARLAVERVARDARLIQRCASIVGPANPSNTLAFTDLYGNAVTFSVSGGNLLRNGNILATGVTSAQPFSFLDRTGNPTTGCVSPNDIWNVVIDVISTQGAESLEIRTSAHPRNF